MFYGPGGEQFEDQRATKQTLGNNATTVKDNWRGLTRTEKHQGWGATQKLWTGTIIFVASSQCP
eukprot:1701447-Lingulodinium_polyedra.AAC.1